MFNWRTIWFGIVFGIIDSIALPIVKSVHNGASKWWMLFPMIFYAADPFIFLKALEHESLTVMNLVWDMTSDITITLVGLFVFAEKLPPLKLLGVIVSLVGLFLMTYEGDGWNAYLARNIPILRNFS
jgi:multidrug transporter EmrE-like cation transporter